MHKQLIPITKPYIEEEELNAVKDILRSGWLVQGKKVTEFEKAVAEHEEVKYCCATSSCTTALQLAMLAEGMKEGMDVLVPSFTFVATANAIVSTGAVPIILDVDCDTYNLSADAVEIYIEKNYYEKNGKWYGRREGNELWGMVPVHQFGLCADMSRLNIIAEKYGIHIIEDAACALGAKISEQHIGGFGNTACVSFHPRKSITTGEGGMILTNNVETYEKSVALRNHGSMVSSDMRQQGNNALLPDYFQHGYNFRMTDIQGAIGCEQMKRLDNILLRRRELAEQYNIFFSNICEKLKIPYIPTGYFHTYQSYVCRLELGKDMKNAIGRRNRLMEKLQASGIQTRQGTHAIHKLKYYKERFNFEDEDFPGANCCDSTTISLPLFVTMKKEEQRYVMKQMLRFIDEI